MPTFWKEQAHVRRLYSAPDSTSELLATCDKTYVPSLAYAASTNSAVVVAEDDATAPRVQLPFPAIDLAWCPFKKGTENAAYATACHSQPIQIWDLEDAELRASYTATNDSDYHVHAHALCWFKAPTHQHWIAGGYGGFEDVTQVRVFDIMAEGSQPIWTYSDRRGKGMVSAMHDCQWQGTVSLLAVGSYNAPSVHLIDCRKRCPVAELHGLKRGVQVIRSGIEGSDPYCVYAGGSQGDSRIACWDVRKPCAPLFTLSRPVHTNQVFEFDLLDLHPTAASDDGASGCSRGLVSTCSTGGVLLYRWRPGDIPSDGTEVHIGASVGPTSGLAVVGPETVVVSTGSRTYDVCPDASKERACTLVQPLPCRDSDHGDETFRPHFPAHRRQRSPMQDGSDEESSLAKLEPLRTTEATNIAVLSLTQRHT
ncbi:conserved hypothetical protein [Leishmania mexicana MHOM/GT/2001/U1103]|uniref:Guanine nucleotide-binding protein subunit beta-like protein n=1 Tax=Leishmania mexicana (strain MHOM/GT/2001/U1103) TaxID=929439 RepID=E9B3E4_LEIMU|nr:conserved hypothetical protein [Leishmania mexicana MHOM/GT/2001/U1103]CBZ29761.1 conserved hypothetical protein [Leishmania mexicana MHOM/GT/2001/U1103]